MNSLYKRTPFRQIARAYGELLSAADALKNLSRNSQAQALALQKLANEIQAGRAQAAPQEQVAPAGPSASPDAAHREWMQKFAARPEELLLTNPECYMNWLGLQTEASMFISADEIRGTVRQELPFPTDGVYGHTAEYTSLLTAIDRTANRERFTAIELGAGWGPWISAVGIVCKRLGFKDINLVGVEAHDAKFEMMREHMARNGLLDVPGVNTRLMMGAAWKEDTELRFPKISVQDHGGAATDSAGEKDYRGADLEHVAVKAFSVPTICEGLGRIDYMHWDIQGAELPTAQASIDFLEKNVRYLFIGTHSRVIEGRLLELFHGRKWDVLHQKPCVFSYSLQAPSIEAMTQDDGELFLRNPHLHD